MERLLKIVELTDAILDAEYARVQRAKLMAEEHEAGTPFRVIGEACGLTHGAVQQAIVKLGPGSERGAEITREYRKRKREAAKDAEALEAVK